MRGFSAPPQLPHPAVQKAAEKVRELSTKLAETQKKRDELERRLVAAEHEDVQSRADALLAGRKGELPGNPATAAAKKELVKCEHLIAGLDLAVQRAQDDFTQGVREHREAMREKMQAALEERLGELEAALIVAEEGNQKLAQARAQLLWLRQFPDGKGYLPSSVLSLLPEFTRRVDGMLGANGEPETVDNVFGALHAYVERLRNPPEPPKPVQYGLPQEQTFIVSAEQ